MDIDIELEKIIEKYDLDKCDPAYRQRKKALAIIKKIVASITGKIAVIATFESDINRFQFLLKDHQADYYYCYKNDIPIPETNYDLNYNMSALDNVCFEKYDYIWLVSLEGSVFVKRWLRQRDIKYHFLYDDLELNNCYCIGNWHSLRRDPEIEWWTRRYWSKPGREWITADTMELVSECGYKCSENVKINHLKKLFFRAIVIRDFYLAEKCIKLLPEKLTNELSAWNAIQGLLQKIYICLKDKKEHMSVIWTDAISYDEINKCKFLSNMQAHAVVFENMYTTCPNTNPTLKSIFCGKLPVSDNTYSIKEFTPDNSVLWKILNDNGYDLCVIGGCQDWTAVPMGIRSTKYHASYGPTSELLWDLWRNMLLKDNPTFFMLHSLLETHTPFLSLGIHDADIIDDDIRRSKSMEYLSEQYQFYMSKLPDKQIKIYMTDHGLFSYHNIYHTFLAIVGLDCNPYSIKEMCSYVDFYKLIKQIIEDGKLKKEEFIRKFVPIEDLDYYSPSSISVIIKNKLQLERNLFGYCGIITKDYIYWHFTDGREWLINRNAIDKVEPNLFGSYVYDESKVQWFRDLVNEREKRVPDFSNKLKYFKYIHMIYDNAKEKNCKKLEIINQIISGYADESIYIRLGGSYCKQIYGVLTKENRKKIAGIIDLNSNCKCAKLGLPIYTSIDALPPNAEWILPSNENFISRAERECAASTHHLQVLNLHKKLKEYGIYTKDCVALFQPAYEDYEVNFPFDEVSFSY